jgi:hypothetical protein
MVAMSIDGSGRISGISRTQAGLDAASRSYVDGRLGVIEDEFTIEGGTKQQVAFDGGSYLLHRFDTDGTLVVTGEAAVSVLVVGGGGGGAADGGGGGGAGGVFEGALTLTDGAYQVRVGVAGAGQSIVGAGLPGFEGGESRIARTGGGLFLEASGGSGGQDAAGGAAGDVELDGVITSGAAGDGLTGGGAGIVPDGRFLLGGAVATGGAPAGGPGARSGDGGGGGSEGAPGAQGAGGVVLVLYTRTAASRVTSLQHPLASEANITLSADGTVKAALITDEKAVTPDQDQTYQLNAADQGTTLVVPSPAEAETTLVVPSSAAVPLPDGARFEIFNEGPSRIELTAASGVTLQTIHMPPFYIPKFGTALLRRRQGDMWAAWGDITGFLPIVAEGGTMPEPIKIDGVLYQLHIFTTVGTSQFKVNSLGTSNGEVEYLVVAGGGAGGDARSFSATPSGGGGAGGLLAGSTKIAVDAYPVVVGAGGTTPNEGAGGDGGESSALSISTVGGGGGGGGDAGTTPFRTGRPGGSGGGSASSTAPPGGAGTPGQGNDGGAGINAGSGGGGGATAAGSTAGSNASGGAGLASGISGASVTYAFGGNGGINASGALGAAGTNGRGNGGQGSGHGPAARGGAGGSGVVIIRYPLVAV